MRPDKADPSSRRRSKPESNEAQWASWADLLVRTQDGDREAYNQLLDEMGPLLYAYVRRRVYDPQLVPDVYQDLLLRFHRVYPTYEPGRPLGPWLFVVARHSVLDSLARSRRVRQREFPVETLPEPEPARPEEGLEDSVAQALERLPPQNREAVVLLKLKGLSLEEAAGRLGISVAALKARSHRAFLLLRRHLVKGDTP